MRGVQGHYCPPGTSSEVPCAPGTYNPTTGVGVAGCQSCPTGSFQKDYGQSSCSPCSSSSTSLAAATSCTCLGLNRVYQPSDGVCLCSPGFEFVDESFTKRSEEDGVQPCQPLVYDFCSSGQLRAADGSCVVLTNGSVSQCSAACGGGNSTGSVHPRTGMCQCDGIKPLEDVCNAGCRATAPQMAIGQSSVGGALALVLTETDPITGDVVQSTITETDVPGFTGSLACSRSLDGAFAEVGDGTGSSSCKVAMLAMVSSGIQGVYDITAAVADGEERSSRRRRRVLSAHSSAAQTSDVHTLHVKYRQQRRSLLGTGQRAHGASRSTAVRQHFFCWSIASRDCIIFACACIDMHGYISGIISRGT
jgi:hypothetical protein